MNLISICFISFIFLFFVSIFLFVFSLNFMMNDLTIFLEWEILNLNSSSIVMTILLDWISLLFMSLVLFISSVVIYYSKEYMHEDMTIDRFIMLVLLFIFSMMMLIISPNLISILLGWDGLGLVSYCLVIYFQNVKSFNAGMLTALSNRIGDVALLMAIAWMLNYGSWNYIFYLDVMKNDMEMEIIGALVVLAAMTKSAQIPFSAWLPAAMAAPTPVSALVHSSTLVTAGIYLLIRFNNLIMNSWLSHLLLFFASMTMLMGGLGGCFEFDLKKIIALSTLSQLGLMMMILAMGYPKLAFLALLTHALYKALLFLCGGAIIHSMNNSQDIRMMGGLVYQMPLTASCLYVACFSLCGMPFLTGYYAKHLIVEMVGSSYMNIFGFFFFFFSAGLSACYTLRLVYYTMISDFNSNVLHCVSDESWVMMRGMLMLLFVVVFGGGLLSWVIFPIPILISVPGYLSNLPLMIALMGGVIGYLISKISLSFFNSSLNSSFLKTFLGSMWFLPTFSTTGITNFPLKSGMMFIKTVDHGWSEVFGGQKIYFNLKNYSKYMQVVFNNSLKIYLMLFSLWVILLFGFTLMN